MYWRTFNSTEIQMIIEFILLRKKYALLYSPTDAAAQFLYKLTPFIHRSHLVDVDGKYVYMPGNQEEYVDNPLYFQSDWELYITDKNNSKDCS